MIRAVQTYQPQISVVLKKNIGRSTVGDEIGVSERYRGAAREIDLTPYLGEDGQVTVSKSVREPAGLFSISFPDRMHAEQSESLYGLIEPMDVIEIRMARDVSLYAGLYERSMPIMMRGFVSNVRRSQVMTGRGPQRTVTVSGQDYGKVLQMMRVEYRFGAVLGQTLLTALKLAINYGVDAAGFDDAADFIDEVMSKVINDGTPDAPGFLAQMRDAASAGLASPVQNIGVIATRGNGAVQPFGAQDWNGGTIYDLLSTFGDVGAFNELFIEDREDGTWGPAGPYLIYRPTPFRNLKGERIQPSGDDGDPETIVMLDEDLIALDIGRGDENVANCFYVNAPRYDLVQGQILKAAALQSDDPSSYVLLDSTNASPKLYGLRVVEASTQQGLRTDGRPEASYETGNAAGIGMVTEKRRILIANNRDNVVLEAGSMQLKGDENVRAGKYIRLSRGGIDFAANYYAHRVTQTFSMRGRFISQAEVDRGTGFAERLQRNRGVNSPYLSEMTVRGTYG